MGISTTKNYGVPDCGQGSVGRYWMDCIVFGVAFLLYLYIWQWDMKQKYERLQNESKIKSCFSKLKALFLTKLIAMAIGTVFMNDATIGDYEEYQYFEKTDECDYNVLLYSKEECI